MEPLGRQNDTACNIKQEEISILVKTEEMESEVSDQQPKYCGGYMETSDFNSSIKSEEVIIKLEEHDYERSGQLLPSEESDNDDTEEQGSTKTYNKPLHNAPLLQGAISNFARSNSTKNIPFRCQICRYQAKSDDILELHILSHKYVYKVKMYKCDLCSYQSRYKSNITKHMLKHKSSSEVRMHKCEFCSYESKYKQNTYKHMNTHLEAPEYKCDLCPFQTKRKRGLLEHSLIHKNPSEVTMYSCPECHFQTKHKRSLIRHRVFHQRS